MFTTQYTVKHFILLLNIIHNLEEYTRPVLICSSNEMSEGLLIKIYINKNTGFSGLGSVQHE
jgi:hypothetical protein